MRIKDVTSGDVNVVNGNTLAVPAGSSDVLYVKKMRRGYFAGGRQLFPRRASEFAAGDTIYLRSTDTEDGRELWWLSEVC